MTRFDTLFQDALDDMEARGLRRQPVATARDLLPSRLTRDGRTLIDVSSNDYLGLSGHPALRERAANWAQRFGVGATASRLVTGTRPEHLSVEAKLAHFKKREAALLFASGWQTNAAVLPALFALSTRQGGAPALVFTDRLNHASMHQGCLAAGVRQIRYRHNDIRHLQEQITRHQDRPGLRFIVTESVFSMDGDRADIGALGQVADAHGAFLYLDEAHATGVLGAQGAGLAGAGGADLVMGTFSKAMGAMGAYVSGSAALCAYLATCCSGFIYSTAPSPPMLGAIDAALDIVSGMDMERARLAAHGATLRGVLADAGLSTGASSTQIVPVHIGETKDALAVARRLAERGILATAIRPPTVPAGTARLRIALNCALSTDDVLTVGDAIIAAVREPS